MNMTKTKNPSSGRAEPSSETQKVALVTGAFSPVGATLARRAMALDYDVVPHHFSGASSSGTRSSRETPLASALTPNPQWQADLRDAKACAALVQAVLAKYGRLDLIVLSAASFPGDVLCEASPAAWDDVWALNVRSAALVIAAAAPALRSARGQVIGVTCASVQAPMRGRAAYCVSKAALSQLLKVAALELAPEVRVNAIAPSTVASPDETRAQQEGADAPLGHGATLADVARAFDFIHDSPGLVGAEIVVDAGTYLQRASRDLR